MKTFMQFIREGRKSGLYKGQTVSYDDRNVDKEYGEVQYQASLPADAGIPNWAQKRMKELSANKSNWDKAVAGGRPTEFSRKQLKHGEVSNVGYQWKKEQPKAEREPEEIQQMQATKHKMKKRIAAGIPIRRPVVLRNPATGEHHLIGGSHRTRWLASKTGRVSMNVIEDKK